jgi:hypothetical protein
MTAIPYLVVPIEQAKLKFSYINLEFGIFQENRRLHLAVIT